MSKFKLLVLFFFFILNYSYSDNNLIFHNYNLKDGLKHPNVKALAQDSKGFMWIGTSEGLHRFDGKNFKYYSISQDSNTIISNDITNLFYHKKNNLLFIGLSGGLFSILDLNNYHFDNYEFSYTDIGETNTVSCFLSYNDSIVLFTTKQPGKLFKFNLIDHSINEININTNDFQKKIDLINQLFLDNKNNLWLVTNSGLLKSENGYYDFNYIKPDKKLCINCFDVNSISQLDSNLLLLLSSKILYTYSYNSGTFEDITPKSIKGTSFKSHQLDYDGNIWISTLDSGLIQFFISKNETINYKNKILQNNTLQSNSISTLFYSKDDKILWIGSIMGLSFLSQQSTNFNYIVPVLNENEVIEDIYGFLKDSEGSIWITSKNDLFYSKNGDNNFLQINKGNKELCKLYGIKVRRIYEDSNKTVWFCTDNGLYSYNLIEKRIRNYKVPSEINYSKQLNNIFNLYQSNNDLWLATIAGICKFNIQTKTFSYYPNPPNYKPDSTPIFARDIYYDTNGIIWLGEKLNGIFKYDINTNNFIQFTYDKNNPKSISSNAIISFFNDSQNNLWIATYNGGLCKYNAGDDSFTRFTINNGLSSNSVYGILEDENKNLWFSTNKGIDKLNINDKTIDNFSFTEGVMVNEFNMGAFFKAFDGEMFFGGVNGIVSFSPEKLISKLVPPKIYITEAYLNNKILDFQLYTNKNKNILGQNKIEFLYKNSTLSFNVNMINFIFPSLNRYSWFLEGYDSEWNYSRENQSYISYTNLAPGQYKLLLKSSTDGKSWSEAKVGIVIQINQPWWKSIWFKILILITSFLGLLLFYNYRLYYINKQKEHLDNLVIEKTEELISLNKNLEEKNEEIRTQNNELVFLNNHLEENNNEIITQNEELEKYRYHLEEIITERTQKLEEAVKIAQESINFKNSILRNLSHEIRTPLNAIIGYSHFLVDDNINIKEKTDILNTINNNSKSLLDVIENLVEISKLETEQTTKNIEKFSLDQLINKVINELNEMFKPDVKVDFTNNNLYISSDKVKLQNILKKIISNALNFTEKGFVKVDYKIISKDKLISNFKIIKNLEYQDYIIVIVEDTGIGIPEDQKDKIFDIFRKVETNKDKLYRGVGLGLSISKRLIDILEGDIWFESKISGGTIFYILFPYAINIVENIQHDNV